MYTKKMLSILSALSISILLTATALATPGNRTPRINKRQVRQQDRIWDGGRSGELTGNEFRRLEREQRMINQEKRAAKADGIVTNRERWNITRDQDRANFHIYRDKHNRRDR